VSPGLVNPTVEASQTEHSCDKRLGYRISKTAYATPDTLVERNTGSFALGCSPFAALEYRYGRRLCSRFSSHQTEI